MSFRSIDRKRRRGTAGFTLVEVLVAIAVVAASLAAIGSLIASNVRSARALDQRLALVETARGILTGLPDGTQLVPGFLSGEIAGHRWRVDIQPYEMEPIDPSRPPPPWEPQAVVVTVQSPTGQVLRVNTIRLHRSEGRKQ